MPDRPNVLVVLCDQLRRQAVGCYGDPNVSTPHLDGLADEGVRFANASATDPICVPSRFSLLTGEYAHSRHAHNAWRMSPAERTLAHELREVGYHTGYVGKWHLADVPSWQPVPAEHRGGFQHWRGFEVKNDPFDSHYFADDDPQPRPIEGYQTDGLTDLAIEYIEGRAGRPEPFCAVLSVEPPHPPFSAPDEYLDRFADRRLELRPNVPYGEAPPPNRHVPPEGVEPYESWGDRETATEDLYERHNYHGEVLLDELRAYYAMVENLDDNVGRLMECLEREGIREETLVVFLSDHGELMGSHGLMMKQHPYEESVGIPAVVAGPGVEGGRVIEEPVSTEDWVPTLLGVAGREADTPGADLSGLLAGDRESLSRAGVLLEFGRETRPEMPYAGEPWRGFRTTRYKYTVKADPGRGAQPWQLFDLRADPYEEENRIAADEETATRLHGLLRDRLAETDDDYPLAGAFGHPPLNQPP